SPHREQCSRDICASDALAADHLALDPPGRVELAVYDAPGARVLCADECAEHRPVVPNQPVPGVDRQFTSGYHWCPDADLLAGGADDREADERSARAAPASERGQCPLGALRLHVGTADDQPRTQSPGARVARRV